MLNLTYQRSVFGTSYLMCGFNCIDDCFLTQDQVDMSRVTMLGPAVEERLLTAFESVKETVEEFTDSYYTSHESREKIVSLSDVLRDDLHAMLLVGQNLVTYVNC